MKTKITTIIFILLLSGCQLIAPYDQKTDEKVTQIHSDITYYLQTSEVPNEPGIKDVEFYNKLKSELHILTIRVQSIPKNEITQEQIELLSENVELLKQLDENGFSEIEATSIQSAIDRTCLAILKLELAKKR